MQFIVSVTASSCPANCSCIDVIPSRYILVACEKGLQKLPAFCPAQTEVFAYTHSEVPFDTLTSTSLLQFANVKILNLSNNNIKYIHNGTFYVLKQLTYLYLDNNPLISEINIGFLHSISGFLKLLSLKNVLPQSSSEDLLWKVVFADDKKFISSKKNINTLFDNLQELRLDENRLTYINTINLEKNGAVKSLSVLGLSKNFLDFKDIVPLLRLKTKTNSEKKHNILHQNIFDTNETATILRKSNRSLIIDLTQNYLTSMDKTFVKFLKHPLKNDESIKLKSSADNHPRFQLTLQENPWSCSCDILTITSFLSSKLARNIIRDWKLLKCSDPQILRGTQMILLT